MDSIMGLSKRKKKEEEIWMVVNRLTKMVNYIPFQVGYTIGKIARKYIEEIVRIDKDQ